VDPLCEFLGKPFPEVEFSRLNDKGQYEKKEKMKKELIFQRILSRRSTGKQT